MNNLEKPPVLPENNKAEKTFEWTPSLFIKMYEVSGHEDVSNYNYNRYLNDEKRWEKNIQTLATIQTNLEKVQHIPEEERAALIRDALNSPSSEVQKVAARMIWHAPEREQIALRQIVTEKICNILNSPSLKTQKMAAEMIEYVSWEEQAAIRQIVAKKIRDLLNSPPPEAQKVAAEMVWYAPEEERAALIRDVLNGPSPEAWKAVVKVIWCIPGGEKNALEQIVAKKIRDTLNGHSPEAWKVAVGMIWHVPEREQIVLRQIITEKIRDTLNGHSPEAWKVAAEMIEYVSREERAALRQIVVEKIRDALNSPSPEAWKVAAEMAWYVSKEEQSSLFKQVLEKTGDTLIKPPLYHQSDIYEERFLRKEFSKTGSRMTLVGRELKNKVIIRHMSPKPFLTWKAIYEDYSFWQENDFDYVPVEPIISYRLEKDGDVAVFSGVLDLSLARWQRITSQFTSELKAQRDKILIVLDKKGIKHGHAHDDNFCLRFWRNENGRSDMTRVPRLYLIDFDEATSS